MQNCSRIVLECSGERFCICSELFGEGVEYFRNCLLYTRNVSGVVREVFGSGFRILGLVCMWFGSGSVVLCQVRSGGGAAGKCRERFGICFHIIIVSNVVCEWFSNGVNIVEVVQHIPGVVFENL